MNIFYDCSNAQNAEGDRIEGACGENPDELLAKIEGLQLIVDDAMQYLKEVETVFQDDDGVWCWSSCGEPVGSPDESPEDHTPYEPHEGWQRGE